MDTSEVAVAVQTEVQRTALIEGFEMANWN
jgi:hypothetical protein